MPSRPIPGLDQPLSDGVVSLRLAAERDIPEVLVAHDEDRELHHERGMPRPPSGAELGRELEEAPTRRAAGIDETLTIETADGPRNASFAGQLIVHSIDWDDRRGELGIWLVPGRRGSAIGRRALVLAARWLFDVWELERLQLVTGTQNGAMLACARAAGFVHEGVLRGHTLREGHREDDAILSLLPSDMGPSS